MNKKWVDNEVYFGPDRRKGGPGKRWGDRRSYDDAGSAPPVGAVMRRLRVQLNSMLTGDERRRAYDLARFAAAEAERQHFTECADQLRAALDAIRLGDFAAADAAIVQAQAAFSGQR